MTEPAEPQEPKEPFGSSSVPNQPQEPYGTPAPAPSAEPYTSSYESSYGSSTPASYEPPPYESYGSTTSPQEPVDGLPPRPMQRRSGRREEELPPEIPPAERNEIGRSSSLLRELPILVFVALALALLIKTFLVQAFFIPSDSMQNTLLEGDRVLVNKFSSHFGNPKRGEVIVFRDPGTWLGEDRPQKSGNAVLRSFKDVFVFVGLLPSDNEKDLIKRVIGVPGDHVACCTNGKVTVNGVPLDEPYLYRDPITGKQNAPSERPFSVTVPPNRLWVMGDHREVSADSRLHMNEPGNGTIAEDRVVGRAFVLVWPLSRWSTLPVPATFKRKELDDAAVQGSAIGLLTLVPLAVVRRRRFNRRPRPEDLPDFVA